jgi:hypothetical protein
MTRFLGNDRMKAVILGGVCFLIAAILMQRVKEIVIKDESIQPLPIAEPEAA